MPFADFITEMISARDVGVGVIWVNILNTARLIRGSTYQAWAFFVVGFGFFIFVFALVLPTDNVVEWDAAEAAIL